MLFLLYSLSCQYPKHPFSVSCWKPSDHLQLILFFISQDQIINHICLIWEENLPWIRVITFSHNYCKAQLALVFLLSPRGLPVLSQNRAACVTFNLKNKNKKTSLEKTYTHEHAHTYTYKQNFMSSSTYS